jgi:hypothetical protein
VDLGTYASYRLPASIRDAFGVETAQQLADQIGLEGTLTPEVGQEAERAYNGYQSGDPAGAVAFLKNHTAMDDQAIQRVLSKLG